MKNTSELAEEREYSLLEPHVHREKMQLRGLGNQPNWVVSRKFTFRPNNLGRRVFLFLCLVLKL